MAGDCVVEDWVVELCVLVSCVVMEMMTTSVMEELAELGEWEGVVNSAVISIDGV
jgi:hypothetical protein